MPPDDIDRTSFAEVVEGVLDLDLPANPPQLGHDEVDNGRVLPVDQAVAVPTLPASIQPQGDPEDRRDTLDRLERYGAQVPLLHARHGALTDAGQAAHVGLPQAPLDPYGPSKAADPTAIHAGMMLAAAHLPHIGERRGTAVRPSLIVGKGTPGRYPR